MKVEVVCSWCGKSMGWKECDVSTSNEISKPVTHGICSKCFDKEMAKIKAIYINKPHK